MRCMTDARDDPAIGVIVLTGALLLYAAKTDGAPALAVVTVRSLQRCWALECRRPSAALTASLSASHTW